MIRVNVGCGRTPVPGWRNFDNSYSIRLSRYPMLSGMLLKAGLIVPAQYDFLTFVRDREIEYGDILKGLPLADGTAEVLYSSHVLEHLDRAEVESYLKEAKRILCSGGIIRLAVPDLSMVVSKYNKTGDADAFIDELYLSQPRPRGFAQKLRAVIVGARHHMWAYDGASLSKLLLSKGFSNPVVLKPGETTIPDPVGLNLSERGDVSLYVEAKR
ncbi:MAG: methyltransferase domain-containing protein [Bacteroidota bacterium]